MDLGVWRNMKKIPYQGRDIEVQEVDVISGNEPWNEYQLTDGKILLIKTVLVEVNRATTDKNPDGSDLYVVSTVNHVRIKS